MQELDASALRSARLAGLIYLAVIGLGMFGEIFVRGSLVVSGNAASTATSILASQTLWSTGIATDLLMHVLDVPLIVFFYLLLRPVNKPLALLSTVLNVVQTCVLAANKLSLVVALLLLQRSVSASAVSPRGLEELAYVAINLHGYGFGVGLIFFGFTCLVRGYLLFKSEFVPRVLGVLLVIAGISYLVNSFALLISPALAAALFPTILLPAFVGELALSLWLLLARHDLSLRGSPPHDATWRAGWARRRPERAAARP
jgi:Domain of unknown function (DUF4386)